MFEETNQTEIREENTIPQENEGILPYSLMEEDEDEHITVKYDGNERKLSLDEAKTLAQKGLNYDRILKKCEEANNVLDLLASRQGMSRQELFESANGEDLTGLRWDGFLKAYPDLDVNTLPDEVFYRVSEGASPIEAYQAHLIREMSQKLSAKENEERTTGSLIGDGGGNQDAFLEGFFGAKY